MLQYEKPSARNLGDLKPTLGWCIDGNSASQNGGGTPYCSDGSAAYAYGDCSNGTNASQPCRDGNNPGM